MKKVLITGSGMLASALARAAPAYGYDPALAAHSQLDITDRSAVFTLIVSMRPDLVFHAAALTRVNYCEQHPEEALHVNKTGTANVVEATEQAMARLVYFSTDYIFDGAKESPWTEADQPHPINVYGQSKLAGETAVQAYYRSHIVRTSGIFGPRDDGHEERNFIRAITEKLLSTNEEIPVVSDQRTALTYGPHLANMVFSLLGEGLAAVTHLTSHGSDSWYGWACHVCQAAGQPLTRIRPVASASLEDATPRPAYSVLSSSAASARAIMMMHPVLPALNAYVAALVNMCRSHGRG